MNLGLRPDVLAAATATLLAGGASASLWVRRRWIVVTVQGGSMLPVLRHGDTLVARRGTGRPPLSVGDIVVIEPPGEDRSWTHPPTSRAVTDRGWMVKRVAGVAGDRLPAGVVAEGRTASTVPPRALAVLGDNGGYDSRVFGLLPCDRVVGVVTRRVAHIPRPLDDQVVANGAPPAML